MTEPQTQEVSTMKPGRIFAFLLFVAMAAAIVFLYTRQQPTAKDDSEVAAMKAELENAKELILQLKEADLHRGLEQRVAESRLAASRQNLQATSDLVAKLKKAITDWNETTSALMASPQGVRLAASSEALAQAEALLRAERPAATLAQSYRARLEPLVKLVEAAEKAEREDLVSFDPGPTFSSELDAIKAEAEPALKAYDEHNRRLAAILAGLTEPASADGPTLKAVLQAREDERLQEENRLLMAEVEKARQENAKKRAEEQAIAERRAGELEREKEREKRELEELQKKAEIAGLVQDKEGLQGDIAEALRRQKLKREFEQDLPEIRSLLRPFITDGRSQPDEGFFRPTTNVGPVSLAALRSEQLLNVTIEDQRRLWYMASDKKRNGRDLGAFPNYIGNATDWNAKQPTVQKAQALLIKYGELMVEEEMLAP
jgi:hypothetical protein